MPFGQPQPQHYAGHATDPLQMERTDLDFADGLVLDLFSPANHTAVVTQNESPLGGNFVTGSTGEPFVALSNYSYIIKVSNSPHDLVAKIEIPHDTDFARAAGVDVSNTYVGTLSTDRRSWVVDESRRNVHV